MPPDISAKRRHRAHQRAWQALDHFLQVAKEGRKST